mmetsp:Transcript_42320/g.123912  ORF Transcript_42320/g.123912 Transcript_42320/m.123912 type:complete len:165 (+) Transcript_42320:159-653(+)
MRHAMQDMWSVQYFCCVRVPMLMPWIVLGTLQSHLHSRRVLRTCLPSCDDRTLIEAKANLDCQTPKQVTALNIACENGHEECAVLLLNAGTASVDACRCLGRHPACDCPKERAAKSYHPHVLSHLPLSSMSHSCVCSLTVATWYMLCKCGLCVRALFSCRAVVE